MKHIELEFGRAIVHCFLILVLTMLFFSGCLGTGDDGERVSLNDDTGHLGVNIACINGVPEVLEFRISPGQGTRGDWFIFSWETVGADSVTISPAIVDLSITLPTSGGIAGRVMYSTWYTLTASKGDQQVTRQAWVEVRYSGGSSWRFPRGDMMNSGRSPYGGPDTNHLAWTFPIGERFYKQAAVIGNDGALYVDTREELIVVNPDGTLKWKLDEELKYPVLAEDGTIYTAAGMNVKALNSDGTEKWSTPISEYGGYGYWTGKLGIGHDGSVIACGIQPDYGVITYLTPGGMMEKSVPTISVYQMGTTADNRIITYGYDFDRYVLQSYDYKGTASAGFSPSLVIGYGYPVTDASGRIFVRANSALRAFDRQGKLLWELPQIHSDGVTGGIAQGMYGTLYALAHSASASESILHAVHRDGWIKWSVAVPGAMESGSDARVVVDKDENIYCMTDTSVTAVNAESEQIWTYTAPDESFYGSILLSMDGTLYVTGVNTLYAFRN